jgi:hypothetical protein
MGHTDPALALRVYRQAIRRDDGEKERLRALAAGTEGQTLAVECQSGSRRPIQLRPDTRNPAICGAFQSAPGRI